jgi:hypothetical protein
MEDGNEDLLALVPLCDRERVRALLLEGGGTQQLLRHNKRRQTPLALALLCGDHCESIVRDLLEFGAAASVSV